MLISGNTLPVLSSGLSEQKGVEPPQSPGRRRDSQPSTRQPTEYIFSGDIEDKSYRSRSSYKSPINIDPANLSAINRYIDTEINNPYKTQKQGRLLDIFI